MLQKKYERGQNYVRNNLGIPAACGGNRISTDHKKVYSSLFISIVTGLWFTRSFSITTLDTVINGYQFRGGCMEYRYFHVPDPVGHHGGTDEQGTEALTFRRMGEKACKDQSGSDAFHLFIRCSDFRG